MKAIKVKSESELIMAFESRPITFRSGLKRPLKAAGNEPLLSSLEKREELRKFVRVEEKVNGTN